MFPCLCEDGQAIVLHGIRQKRGKKGKSFYDAGKEKKGSSGDEKKFKGGEGENSNPDNTKELIPTQFHAHLQTRSPELGSVDG